LVSASIHDGTNSDVDGRNCEIRLGFLARCKALKRPVFGGVFIGFSKSLVFGFILATDGCCQGLRVEGGTAGVVRATIRAFVVFSLAILVADLFLTPFLLYAFLCDAALRKTPFVRCES